MERVIYIICFCLFLLCSKVDAQIYSISIVDSAEKTQLKSKQTFKNNADTVSFTNDQKKYQRGVFPQQLLVSVTETQKDTSSTKKKGVFAKRRR